MELGSILTVHALNLDKNENVLEMCCSPGAKLLYISDIIKSKEGKGKGIVKKNKNKKKE